MVTHALLLSLVLAIAPKGSNSVDQVIQSVQLPGLSNLQFYENQLYVGGTNKLYQLNGNDLSVTLTADTCTQGCSENVNQVLVLSSESGQVFTCGTGNKGRCELRNLANISDILATSDDLEPFQVSSDIKRPAQAIFVKTDTSEELMLGLTFGAGVDVDVFYALSTRKVDVDNAFTVVASNSFSKKLTMANPHTFLIYYKAVLQHGQYTYYVTNQQAFVGYPNLVSKLVRICQKDDYYRSYTDMIIQCSTETGTYNLVQDAIFVSSAAGGNPVLVAAFSKGGDAENPEDGSILCTLDLPAIDASLVNAKREFQTCKGNSDTGYKMDRTMFYFPVSSTPCLPANDTVLSSDCEIFDTYIYMVGETPVDFHYKASISPGQGYVTTLQSSTLEDRGVVLAGTTRGHIVKYVYVDGDLREFDSFTVGSDNSSSAIKAIYQRSDTNYYVMTENKVMLYSSSSCAGYSTCQLTMEGANPLCGWCVYEARATRKNECSRNAEANHWLSAVDQCVSIDVNPKGVPLNEEVKVTINVIRYPAIQEGDSYVCRISSTPVPEINAEVESPGVMTCTLPSQSEHLLAKLELLVTSPSLTTSIVLAETSFFYYDCAQLESCGECIRSVGANCTWCTGTTSCVSNSSSSTCTSPTNQFDGCPQLESEKLYVPVGERVTKEIKAKSLPQVADVVVYTCKIPDLNIEVESSSQTASVVNCDFDIPPTALPAGDTKTSYSLEVWYKIQDQKSTKLEDDVHSQVIVYECSRLGVGCSYCDALMPVYSCTWCQTVGGEDRCAYSGTSKCTTTDTCPPPHLTSISPHDGPALGSTIVTIEGTNLGTDSTTNINTTVAGSSCQHLESMYDKMGDDFSKLVRLGFTCERNPGEEATDQVIVSINNQQSTQAANVKFITKVPDIAGIEPVFGPRAGGTRITLVGENLSIGNKDVGIEFEPQSNCTDIQIHPNIDLGPLVNISNVNFTIRCTIIGNYTNNITKLIVTYDGYRMEKMLTYSFVSNPIIKAISPAKAFLSGGTSLTITGDNLDHANKGSVALQYKGDIVTEECHLQDPQMVICNAPRAPDSLISSLSSKLNNTTTGRRRKREVGKEPVKLIVHLDGVKSSFSLEYYPDPSISQFAGNDGVKLFGTDSFVLTIKGGNLNLVATESDVNVTIGLETCKMVSISLTNLTCLAPGAQPAPGRPGLSYPEVNVSIGNVHSQVGYLQYQEETEQLLIIIVVISCVLVALVVLGTVIGCFKYRQTKRKMVAYRKDLTEMELEIREVAREEFLDMHTTMSTVSRNLVEQGFPFHDYQQYACNVMFASDYLLSEPVMTDDVRSRTPKGMERFEALLLNKFFLVSLISTMERQKRFFIREKSDFAGNLSAILMGRMDFVNEVLCVLLANLVAESPSKKVKTLFRRCESITEKLLSNWLSLCLYPHLKKHTGSPLYLMYIATLKTMDSGPIDAVTGDAKYTLSEEKLLKKYHGWSNEEQSKEAKTLTLNMVVDNGTDMYECRVLDCDTISQVKTKCLEQIYVNYPASQLTVDVADLVLEWCSGFGGRLKLQDEDNTSIREGGWIRLNTLAHYAVGDNSNMALVDPNCGDQQENYVNLAQVQIEGSIGSNGSIDSTQLLTGPDHYDEENPVEIKHWHLVKTEEEVSKQEKSAIAELYLNRLFTTKQSLLEYMKPLFMMVLDKDLCPPPTKYLYDILDDLGERNKVDPEIVHAWKSHSYSIRVWATLIKSPSLLFDVNVPSYVSENLDIISQVFIESFSISPQKFTKDSPAQKLIFHNEMNLYREKAKEFYKNVKVTDQSAENFRQYILEVNRAQQNTHFKKNAALYRLYQQIKPYITDILEDLSMCKETSSLQLNRKLEEIFDYMEEAE